MCSTSSGGWLTGKRLGAAWQEPRLVVGRGGATLREGAVTHSCATSSGVSSGAGRVAIGLDTSVVLRLLVGVPEAQARAAQRRLERAIEGGESVFVCDLVIAEAYYALQFHYAVPKAEARSMLIRFVRSGVVTVGPREAEGVSSPSRTTRRSASSVRWRKQSCGRGRTETRHLVGSYPGPIGWIGESAI